MSKFLALFLILISQLIFFPAQTLAVSTPTCGSMGITYEPAIFSANPSDITINFTISDKTTAENIQKAGNVRLHFITGGSGFVGDINTKSVPVTVTNKGGSFTINVLDVNDTSVGNIRLQSIIDELKSPKEHPAVLDWQYKNRGSVGDSGDFDELCTGISYYVGSPYACVIDPGLQDPVPLGQPFTIAFSGKASTEYQLFVKPNGLLSGFFTGPKYFVTKTTTKADSQGSFDNLILSNISSGDKVDISIAATDAFEPGIADPVNSINPLMGPGIARYNICTVTRQVSISVTPKPAPSSVPTPGPGAGVVGPGTGGVLTPAVDICKIDPKKCTLAGGETCPGGKGIKTAIGCIHTDPEGFVKDFLSFAVGISGGLAFLMMLLGAFQMLTSAGNPETLQAGRDRFSSAIIGLLIVVLSVLLLKIIGVDILGIPGFTA